MSKDISIHSLYNDVLKELPFTVSGNASIEKTIFQFLQKVAESPFLVDNKQIKFVMGGFAKIKLYDLQHLFKQKWETKRLRSFFFYDYENDDVELLLSIYQHCLSEITKTGNASREKTKNITNIICDNNYSGVNFRVKVVDNISKLKITYNRRDHVLEALLPTSFYKTGFTINNLAAISSELTPNVERSKQNFYEYFRKESKSDYQSLMRKIFAENLSPSEFNENYTDFLLNSHIEESIKLNFLNNPNANIKEIYCLFYTAGVLAYLLDCNIEYFTSVANTIGGCKYSLGSIAVGYKSEQLSNDTRAFFSITSNHIASNLASQILLDSSNMQYYLTKRKQQEQFIKDFITEIQLQSHEPHCGYIGAGEAKTVISLTKKSIEIDNTKLTLGSNIYSKEEMENSFGKGFLDYLNKVLSYEKIDWGLYEGFHGNAECCKQINRFYEKCKKSDCDGIGLVLYANKINPNQESVMLDKPIANVYLPHLLISTIESDSKRKFKSISTETKDSKACIRVVYENDIDISSLIKALNSETGNGGSFITFIKESYDAFRICGDMAINDGAGRFQISLKNDFKVSTENGKLNFVFVGNPNPIVTSKELIFEIHYNLF